MRVHKLLTLDKLLLVFYTVTLIFLLNTITPTMAGTPGKDEYFSSLKSTLQKSTSKIVTQSQSTKLVSEKRGSKSSSRLTVSPNKTNKTNKTNQATQKNVYNNSFSKNKFSSVTGMVLSSDGRMMTPIKGVKVVLKDSIERELDTCYTDSAGFFSFNISKHRGSNGFTLFVKQEALGFNFTPRKNSVFTREIGRFIDSREIKFVYSSKGDVFQKEKVLFLDCLDEFRTALFSPQGMDNNSILKDHPLISIKMKNTLHNMLFSSNNTVISPSVTDYPMVRYNRNNNNFTFYLPKTEVLDRSAILRLLSRACVMAIAPFCAETFHRIQGVGFNQEYGGEVYESMGYLIEIADFLAASVGAKIDSLSMDDLVGLSLRALVKVKGDVAKRIKFYSLYADRMRKASTRNNEYEILKLSNMLQSDRIPDAEIFRKKVASITSEFRKMRERTPIVEDYVIRLSHEKDRFSKILDRKRASIKDASNISGMTFKILKDFAGVVNSPHFTGYILSVIHQYKPVSLSDFINSFLKLKPYNSLYDLLPKYGSFQALKIKFIDTYREIDPGMNTDFEIDRAVDIKLDIDEEGNISQLENLKEEIGKYSDFSRGKFELLGQNDSFSLERFIYLTEQGNESAFTRIAAPSLPKSSNLGQNQTMEGLNYYTERIEDADIRFTAHVYNQKLKEFSQALDSNYTNVKNGQLSFALYQKRNRNILKKLKKVIRATQNSIDGEAAVWYHQMLRKIKNIDNTDKQKLMTSELNKALVEIIKTARNLKKKYATLTDLTFRRTMDLGNDIEDIRKTLGAAAEKFLMSEDVLINRLTDTSKLFKARYETGDVNKAVKKAITDLEPVRQMSATLREVDLFTDDHIRQIQNLAGRIRSESAPVNELQDCLRFFYDKYQKLSIDLKVTAKNCGRRLDRMVMDQGTLLEDREKDLTYLLNGVVVSYDPKKLFERFDDLQNRVLSINRFEISRYLAETSSILSDLEALEGTVRDRIKAREKQQALKRSFLVDLLVCSRPVGFEVREFRIQSSELQGLRGMVVITGRLGRRDAQVKRIVASRDGGQTWDEVSGVKYWVYDFYPKPGAVYNMAFKIIGVDDKVINADTPVFSIVVKDM